MINKNIQNYNKAVSVLNSLRDYKNYFTINGVKINKEEYYDLKKDIEKHFSKVLINQTDLIIKGIRNQHR